MMPSSRPTLPEMTSKSKSFTAKRPDEDYPVRRQDGEHPSSSPPVPGSACLGFVLAHSLILRGVREARAEHLHLRDAEPKKNFPLPCNIQNRKTPSLRPVCSHWLPINSSFELGKVEKTFTWPAREALRETLNVVTNPWVITLLPRNHQQQLTLQSTTP